MTLSGLLVVNMYPRLYSVQCSPSRAMGSTERGHIQEIWEGLNISTKSISQLRMMCNLGHLATMCFEAKSFNLKFIDEH